MKLLSMDSTNPLAVNVCAAIVARESLPASDQVFFVEEMDRDAQDTSDWLLKGIRSCRRRHKMFSASPCKCSFCTCTAKPAPAGKAIMFVSKQERQRMVIDPYFPEHLAPTFCDDHKFSMFCAHSVRSMTEPVDTLEVWVLAKGGVIELDTAVIRWRESDWSQRGQLYEFENRNAVTWRLVDPLCTSYVGDGYAWRQMFRAKIAVEPPKGRREDKWKWQDGQWLKFSRRYMRYLPVEEQGGIDG